MKRSPMKRTPMKKTSRPKMTAIRKSARDQECQVRIPGFCNGDPSTTILAHINGAGMGVKASDHEAAYSCSACHAWLDGGYASDMYDRDDRDLFHLLAVIRTQRLLIEQGLLRVAA